MKQIGDGIKRTLSRRNGTRVQYSIVDGLKLLKNTVKAKFIESVEAAINLGIDARKSDQSIRSNVILPHGIGKSVRVAVFTQGKDKIKLAKDAGAELVGLEDLYDKIKADGCVGFDVVLASPDVMHIVSKLGSILGPRGLMPNPKMGTISSDIQESIKNVKLGQVRYKNDKNGIVHAIFGKIDFSIIDLKENLETLIASIQQVKPVQFKGTYIKKISISTTMGKSVILDKNSFSMVIY
ncbi:50S ribosomal protein L1 [Candidatus Blochmanniella vafra str. BVAF]|uniref:Large ribosomal subunit protein uL1 n=1 Tax=Blochmanniella vafra (strain BVAF) TaxID=859654 RepID=E8Q6H1_BLOVB|nr:50S ribosomal protein L1 [Candidatus Blochmannia vafer]ADV33940.1 50S ribosomal protein L1 [Candidatus Blochmannia vafer str. BVAF]